MQRTSDHAPDRLSKTRGLFGEMFETIPLSRITSVETLSRMGYRVLRLHTSHDELAFKTFESKEHFDEV